MNMDMITQYVAMITPSVTAIGVCIGTLLIGVAKVRKAFNEAASVNSKTLRKMDEMMETQHAIMRENAELKRQNAALERRIIRKIRDEGEEAPDGNE